MIVMGGGGNSEESLQAGQCHGSLGGEETHNRVRIISSKKLV